jgi:hypothetical protein
VGGTIYLVLLEFSGPLFPSSLSIIRLLARTYSSNLIPLYTLIVPHKHSWLSSAQMLYLLQQIHPPLTPHPNSLFSVNPRVWDTSLPIVVTHNKPIKINLKTPDLCI